MTYPILYEINQYIKQIYDVKTSIKKKLNYEFFYSFNFFISCIICKILFIFSSKITKAYITIYECIHFVIQIYIVSSWSQGLPSKRRFMVPSLVVALINSVFCQQCAVHILLNLICVSISYQSHPSLLELPVVPPVKII